MFFILNICCLLFFISNLNGQESRQYINGDNESSQMIVNDYGNNRTILNSTHRTGKNLFGVLGFLTGYRLGQGYGANSQGNLNLFGKMFNGALHLAYSKAGVSDQFGQQFQSDYPSLYPSYPYSNYPYYYPQYNNPQISGFPLPYHAPNPQHPVPIPPQFSPPQFPPPLPPIPQLPPPHFPFPPGPSYPIPPGYPGHPQYPIYPTHPTTAQYYPSPTNNPPLTSPANQQQIVNIHEPLNANDPPQENYQEVRDKNRQSIINRINEPGGGPLVRGGGEGNDEVVYPDDNDNDYVDNDDSENRNSSVESSEVIYRPVNRKTRPQKAKKDERVTQLKLDGSSKGGAKKPPRVVNGNDIILQIADGKPSRPVMKKPGNDTDTDTDGDDDEETDDDEDEDTDDDNDLTTNNPQIQTPPATTTEIPRPFIPGTDMPEIPEKTDIPEIPDPEQRPPDINTMAPFLGYGPPNGNENISITNLHDDFHSDFRPTYPYLFDNYIPAQYQSHPIKIVDPHALEVQDEHKPWAYHVPDGGHYSDSFPSRGNDHSYSPQYNHFDSFEFTQRSRKSKSPK